MKKIGYALGIICLALLFSKCCEPCAEEKTPICKKASPESVGPNIKLIPNELVVRIDVPIKTRVEGPDAVASYIDALTVKINKRLNIELETGPENIEYCPCDPSQQVWSFPSDSDLLEIEDIVTSTEDENGDNRVEGDQQFIITLPKEGEGLAVDPVAAEEIFKEYRVPNEVVDGVHIAIFDTGLDLSYFDETNRENRIVLYANPEGLTMGRDCLEKGKSGWNFVDNNYDISDDHKGIGHGTLVTKTITDELKRTDTPYSILPIKVFDKNGRGKYSTILCGMSFLDKVQSLNRNIKIVNASFGGNFGHIPPERTKIFQDYINKFERSTLVVTSAGNCHFNTDDGLNNHYPSGYTSNNLVSVAGYELENNRVILSDSSNYGQVSIDVAARFARELTLTNTNGTKQVKVKGTSYSAAFVTGRVAELIKDNLTLEPDLLKQEFLSTFPSNNNRWTEKAAGLASYISGGRYVPEEELDDSN